MIYIYALRRFAKEAQYDSCIGAVTLAGSGKGTVEIATECVGVLRYRRDKGTSCLHRSHGV